MDISIVRSDGSRMSMGVEIDETPEDIKNKAIKWCGEEKQVVSFIVIRTYIFKKSCEFLYRCKAMKAKKAMKAMKAKRARKAKKAMKVMKDKRATI